MSSTWAGIIFAGTLVIALALVHKPLGDYMARVLMGKRHLAVEKGIYRVGGIDPQADQTWGRYLRSVLAFSAVSVLFLYGFLRLQQHFWPPYDVPQMSHISRSTRRRASSPIRTGSRTQGRALWAMSRRWQASPCRTSCRPRPASQSR
jgi:K+-transporting ATPase A subunit